MSDWMFASEGDPANLGRPGTGTARRERAWSPGSAADEATGDVARRLQARLDRHLWLLDGLGSDPLLPDPPGLPELLDTGRRMLRDTRSLLLMSGQEPATRSAGAQRLADVLAEAAGAAEEPRRVDIATAPGATLEPAAAVELIHVLAELIDDVAAAHRGARVAVAGWIESRGITVEVSLEGGDRRTPACPGATAERLAARSRCGLELRAPAVGPPLYAGPVASVYCPPPVVTVDGPARPAPSVAVDPFRIPSNGNGHPAGGGPARAPATPAPAYTPSASSQVDELFGPLIDLPTESLAARTDTPIFEAIASAWFREGAAEQAPGNGRDGGAPDWETPQDREWRAAAERAARPDPLPTTASGLPRRRPGNQLVPPPVNRQQAPDNTVAERVPDRVRDRLSTYQRGLQQGRHRAPGFDDA